MPGLIAVVVALTAAITWAVLAFAFDSGTPRAVSAPQRATTTFRLAPEHIEALSTLAPQTELRADALMSLTPGDLAGVGLGTGYQLPDARRSPSAADVLASMSPAARSYTEKVMNLTFEQLAAGAAGQP